MKASGVIIFMLICLLAAAGFSADKTGHEIFKSKGCFLCHRQNRTSGTNPTLSELANAYKGKKEQLIQFFKGETQPIVHPQRAVIMKRQIEKTKALSDSERAALADFILSH